MSVDAATECETLVRLVGAFFCDFARFFDCSSIELRILQLLTQFPSLETQARRDDPVDAACEGRLLAEALNLAWVLSGNSSFLFLSSSPAHFDSKFLAKIVEHRRPDVSIPARITSLRNVERSVVRYAQDRNVELKPEYFKIDHKAIGAI